MLTTTFFNASNVWFGYISNIFFTATAVFTIFKLAHKLIMKNSKEDIEALKKAQNENDEKLEKILEQYRPNGGSSSKDQWNRVECSIYRLEERFDEFKQEFSKHLGYHEGLKDSEI